MKIYKGRKIINGSINDYYEEPPVRKNAQESVVKKSKKRNEVTSDFAGFKEFKRKYPKFPLLNNKDIAGVYSNARLFRNINAKVNSFGSEDVSQTINPWEFLESHQKGNCMHCALTKAKLLLKEGISADSLHIEVGKATLNWHAWLQVSTTEGDLFLDNKNAAVLRRSPTQISDRQRFVGGVWVNTHSDGTLLESIEDIPLLTIQDLKRCSDKSIM